MSVIRQGIGRPIDAGDGAALGAALNREIVPLLKELRTLALSRNGGKVSATADLIVGSEDQYVLCDCTDGAITVTLLAAGDSSLMELVVIKTDSSANTVTIEVDSADDSIDGASTASITSQYGHVRLVSDGSNDWFTV